MPLTDDPNDPRLGYGSNSTPGPQNEVYLVLSEEERNKGYVRPFRDAYKHVGIRPKYPIRDLNDKEKELYASGYGYVKYEEYPESERPLCGRMWTQEDLNSGCGVVTTMGYALSATYARDPKFYGATYCCGCNMHKPVGPDGEFDWLDGTKVGS